MKFRVGMDLRNLVSWLLQEQKLTNGSGERLGGGSVISLRKSEMGIEYNFMSMTLFQSRPSTLPWNDYNLVPHE